MMRGDSNGLNMPMPSPRLDLRASVVQPVVREVGWTSVRETSTARCRRVLLIESSADCGAALCALFETGGHETVVALTGREGLRQARRRSSDVIVIDLGLGDMDGCKVVQLIRAEPAGHVPVIIAYSGYHHRETEALKAGCDAFVLKPAIEELEWLILATRAEVQQFVETAGPAVGRRFPD